MKTIFPVSFLILLLLQGCASTELDDGFTANLEMSGDMLFEGSNTLQMQSITTPEALASHAGTEPGKLKQVSVNSAQFQMSAEHAAITESLLLQVVSDNNALVTVGTLSPLSDPNALSLSLSEDMDLLPYLKDTGCTWVLDLNLSEDYMDELKASGSLKLSIAYTP